MILMMFREKIDGSVENFRIYLFVAQARWSDIEVVSANYVSLPDK